MTKKTQEIIQTLRRECSESSLKERIKQIGRDTTDTETRWARATQMYEDLLAKLEPHREELKPEYQELLQRAEYAKEQRDLWFDQAVHNRSLYDYIHASQGLQ